MNQQCSEIYTLIKKTLLSDFGYGAPPSIILEELNIYFIYKSIILKAESDYDRQNKGSE